MEVVYLRADGSVISTSRHTAGFMPPGSTRPTGDATSVAEEPAEIRVQVTETHPAAGPPADAYLPFVVEGEQRGDVFSGTASNPYSASDDIAVGIAITTGGSVIWVDYAIIDAATPGKSRPWTIESPFDLPDGEIVYWTRETSPVGWAELAAR